MPSLLSHCVCLSLLHILRLHSGNTPLVISGLCFSTPIISGLRHGPLHGNCIVSRVTFLFVCIFMEHCCLLLFFFFFFVMDYRHYCIKKVLPVNYMAIWNCNSFSGCSGQQLCAILKKKEREKRCKVLF